MTDETIVWKRPSGSLIETNALPDTVDYCEAQGWERAEAPKRRGRPPKDRSGEGEPSE